MPISKLALGSVQFGMDYGISNKRGKIPKDEAHEILKEAFNKGINTIDTAAIYEDSEETIGSFVKECSGKLEIISKLPSGSEYSQIDDKMKASLSRLNIDLLYGYLIHNFKDYERDSRIWDRLERLKKEGKVKKIGFSLDFTSALETILKNELAVDLIQIPYSIFNQDFAGYLKELKKRKIEIHVRSVFLQGLVFIKPDELNGKFMKIKDKIRELNLLSSESNVPISALCLNFALANQLIDKVIIGVESIENLTENLRAIGYKDKIKAIMPKLSGLREEEKNIILPFNWKIARMGKKANNVVAIIQARVGSTRLPGKVLLDLAGKPVIEHMISRVKASKSISRVVVATTNKNEDIPIVNICSNLGIEVYQGSENDVLGRYYQAAKLFSPDHIVRITADCPLIDPDVIDKVVKAHIDTGSDYTSNCIKETYPNGEDVEVFTFEALEKAWKASRLKSEREHVTVYIKQNPSLFKLFNVECELDLSEKRWTLDEERDYKFLRIIYDNLYTPKVILKMKDILGFLNEHPEVEEINKDIVRNEGYLKSLETDGIFTPES